MTIPKLKRIKISSELELRTWLTRSGDQHDDVMLVTYKSASDPRHVSRQIVHEALADHGFVGGPRYTLNTGLLGHVISRKTA